MFLVSIILERSSERDFKMLPLFTFFADVFKEMNYVCVSRVQIKLSLLINLSEEKIFVIKGIFYPL